MAILVLGGTGQVGYELLRALAPLGRVIAPTRNELPLTDSGTIESYLRQLKPTIIVNAAAWTAVDAAETEREAAFTLNATLPKVLAEYCRINYAQLVHYSSDYVFPGTGDTAWSELSETAPQNYYGVTKLAGDSAITTSGASYLIFRTSWVYSSRGSNFMKTMLKLAETREQLSIVSDQIGAPTPARLIAMVTAMAIHHELASGIYNLAPRGECSWFEFAEKIFEFAKRGDTPKKLALKVASKIATKDYPTPAKRPLNSRLALEKLENALGIRLPTWQSQLELTLQEYLGDE